MCKRSTQTLLLILGFMVLSGCQKPPQPAPINPPLWDGSSFNPTGTFSGTLKMQWQTSEKTFEEEDRYFFESDKEGNFHAVLAGPQSTFEIYGFKPLVLVRLNQGILRLSDMPYEQAEQMARKTFTQGSDILRFFGPALKIQDGILALQPGEKLPLTLPWLNEAEVVTLQGKLERDPQTQMPKRLEFLSELKWHAQTIALNYQGSWQNIGQIKLLKIPDYKNTIEKSRIKPFEPLRFLK